MVVQWLKLYTPSAGALGSIPCQATKILCAMRHNEKKKLNFFFFYGKVQPGLLIGDFKTACYKVERKSGPLAYK